MEIDQVLLHGNNKKMSNYLRANRPSKYSHFSIFMLHLCMFNYPCFRNRVVMFYVTVQTRYRVVGRSVDVTSLLDMCGMEHHAETIW